MKTIIIFTIAPYVNKDNFEQHTIDGFPRSTDGLDDCLDSDCCVSIACKDSMHCVTSPDPMEILLRKQPPSSTASFYERMRFLVEEDSVQSYATLTSFNERYDLCQSLTLFYF